MENLGFQDSDQYMYESALGSRQFAVMAHMRHPQHPATLHQPVSRNPCLPQGHGNVYYGNNFGNGSNTIGHTHVTSHHGIPATAHIHGGRVVGVTGVPSSVGSNPGLVNSFAIASSQPLYSCQAPRGHDHVYQCPGHRDEHLVHRNHPVEYSVDLKDASRQHQFEQRCENHPQSKQHYVEHRESSSAEFRDRQVNSGPEQRTEYHYGGSDYSSTEPIYAQPHLQPLDEQSSPSRTPIMNYKTVRGSMRLASNSSTIHHHGTPARFMVKADSTGASTSSTLPTVSALMAMDSTNSRGKGQSHRFRKVTSLSSSNPSSKLKGIGMWDSWKSKYFDGARGTKKVVLLVGLLVLLLILVLGGLAAVLYLTLGDGIGSIVGQAPQLVHLTEEGSSVVMGQFRITNQNYWPGLDDVNSESFRILSRSIEKEMDSLFLNSVWSREYNRSEIVSMSEGFLMIRARLYLNTPDTSAAKKLGSAFLRGLEKRHDQEWLGQYSVDISSIRFAEVLVDSTSPDYIDQMSGSFPDSLSTTVTYTRKTPSTSKPGLNVGWGEWGPWSSCNPCSPQYDQIRTRKCHLDDGKGVLVSNIELCSPGSQVGHLQSGTQGNMESRPCQCREPEIENEEENRDMFEEYFSEYKDEVDRTTMGSVLPSDPEKNSRPIPINGQADSEDRATDYQTDVCRTCGPNEVCVALRREKVPSCRPETDSSDPTGCGGLCALDEVCQVLGPRAFECHSTSQCLNDEWRCADGLCIPQAKRCDGHHNCYDRSDEVMCSCGVHEFHCGGRTSCLPLNLKCDGNVDCWDGFDEANCSIAGIDSKNSDIHTNSQLPDIVPKSPANTRLVDGEVPSPAVPGVIRLGGTTVVNRTAIGLSSLSNRERELLS